MLPIQFSSCWSSIDRVPATNRGRPRREGTGGSRERTEGQQSRKDPMASAAPADSQVPMQGVANQFPCSSQEGFIR
jgi:hypothetical protein